MPVPLLLGVPVAEELPVAAGVELPEREAVLVVEALAPGDRLAVALPLTVELALRVLEGVSAGVPVPLTVGEAVPVPLGELLLVALPEREELLLSEEEAPLLKEAVGLPDRVELELSVEEGVLEGEAELLLVCVPEGVGDWLRDAERLLLLLSLPLEEALAPRVKEAVGDPDTEELRLLLLEGVGAALLLPLCV